MVDYLVSIVKVVRILLVDNIATSGGESDLICFL